MSTNYSFLGEDTMIAPSTTETIPTPLVDHTAELNGFAASLKPIGAIKNDNGKLDLTLVPVEAMEAIARGMMYGAKKYGRGNYRQSGMGWSRLAAACLRHLFAWLFGEELDPESGNSHLDHALCSLAMLAFQTKHHKEMDDR